MGLGGFGIFRRFRRINREFFFESNKEKWFYNILLKNRKTSSENPYIAYYEFGTDVGTSLISYMKVLKKVTKEHKKDLKDYPIVAFDSFQGLPDPKQYDTESQLKENWYKGQFSCSKKQLLKNIKKRRLDPNEFNLRFVEGFYEESLTEQLREELPKPTIINIDCDYYSSTKTVLDWLRPINGAKFYFDDIWKFSGNPNLGELRAISEFNQNNRGSLIPYPVHGMPSQSFIYYNGKTDEENSS